jgi:hypothetical protein
MFSAPGLVFGGTEGAGSHFHVLRAWTSFRRYGGHQVPFSSSALLGTFSAIQRASGLDFIFCAPELIFDGTEGVNSRFHVLRARTHFRCYRGRRVRFHILRSLTHFRRYRGRRVPFSCFVRSDLFSTIPRASAPFVMFLCSRTYFRWSGGCRVPFSYFALPDTFSAVWRALGLDIMFCAPGLVFGGTEGVGFCFYVLRTRTHFLWYRRRRVPFTCFASPHSFSAVPRAMGPVFMYCA